MPSPSSKTLHFMTASSKSNCPDPLPRGPAQELRLRRRRVSPFARRLKYECIYLRPTQGRADDQLRRNHSVQYISHPEYPWERLRKENPSQYETYTDLVPGEWTKVKIEVKGNKARLWVNGSDQPTMLVNDLKLGDAQGPIALLDRPRHPRPLHRPENHKVSGLQLLR